MTNLTENQKHEICQRAVVLKKDIEFRFLELGALLHEIREQRHFEAGWDSWEEYALELKMSSATISKLIRIYEVFILKFQFSHAKMAALGGWSVAAELLPDVKESTTKAEIEVWMGEATELSRPDLRRAIIERRRGIEMAECKHEDTYTLKICRDCGERWHE